MKGSATKDAIVAETLRQVTLVGFEGLSLAPLANSLGLSKSGLFAHFKSKDALQLDVFEEATKRFRASVIEPSQARPAGEERLASLLENWRRWLRGSPDDGGCLFMAIAQECDDQPGPMRDLLVASQREWRALLASVVRDGVAHGAFRPETDAMQIAFELIGAAHAYQHALRLLGDNKANVRVQAMLERIVASIRI
ncbi:AcrR family transcriptional regulator [Sphingomonas sp. UYAg733]